MPRPGAIEVPGDRPCRPGELHPRRDRLDGGGEHDVLMPHHAQHVVDRAGVTPRQPRCELVHCAL